MDQETLEGMQEPAGLALAACGGQVLVRCGRALLYRYEEGDTGMRNLAIVALTDAGRRVDEVASVFGLTATYVSMLRGRARAQGSAGLVRRRGRPPKLTDRQVAKARAWAGEGVAQRVIADRLGVAQSGISELLARRGPTPVQQELLPEPGSTAEGQMNAGHDTGADAEAFIPAGDPGTVSEEGPAALARIGEGSVFSRYAGAMLLHAFLDRVGAETIFATLAGAPGRRYDNLAVLTTATLGFALGAGTMEGFKHLRRGELGPTAGVETIPELATLRGRLTALADASDPLALQRAFAAGMLAFDPAADPVYYVDDHFVPYAGAKPVAKGWNTKRRHAEPGRDETVLVDARGRAVVFGSGEPTSLASNLPGVLTQLRRVIGPDAPVLLGFDRGGAFPIAFTACRDAGAGWISYRRAPLVATTATPAISTTVRNGKDITVELADETVAIKDYGHARQLTLFEHGSPVLQVLTSETTGTGADLLCWLRSRWRIENMFKYASEHNGIDAIADYRMDVATDTRLVANPARVAARATVKTAETGLADAERSLAQLLASGGTPKQMNAALPGIHRRIEKATQALADAKKTLKPIRAKLPANTLNPDAKLARPHLQRRSMQMVLRLLAFNAEAWLADRLNAYLNDPDEYRAITSNLLHQGGTITYGTHEITVILDAPDSPRTARALQLLTEELNNTPTRLPGDRRPLNYQIAQAPISTMSKHVLQEV
ncbi:putative transposase [Arthrobacter sp. H35-D1]|uniref:putative transposase n=1 Tax=Arthrobacter sp. H35-D1 TaxID=3046202 RepID=UPI0024B8C639|nr:helix-turn-helix domain-containing protein [Arthrobacter sp. H35-D1]MDJ0315546.1 helix-turn-helix domain-containing protein [Arthrobacter sp. H35-D1]